MWRTSMWGITNRDRNKISTIRMDKPSHFYLIFINLTTNGLQWLARTCLFIPRHEELFIKSEGEERFGKEKNNNLSETGEGCKFERDCTGILRSWVNCWQKGPCDIYYMISHGPLHGWGVGASRSIPSDGKFSGGPDCQDNLPGAGGCTWILGPTGVHHTMGQTLSRLLHRKTGLACSASVTGTS